MAPESEGSKMSDIRYGLSYKNELMGYMASKPGNDDGYGVYIEYELDNTTENVWLVKRKEVAEKAAITSAKWYNADYDTPINRFIGKLKVVKVELNIIE